jgi:hypothetical protein
VLEPVDLLVDGRVHAIVAMAHADGKNAAEEIEILVAIGVIHELVFGARDHQRLLVVMEDRRKKELLAREDNFVFSHRQLALLSQAAEWP